MTPKRMEQIRRLFAEAMNLPLVERSSFLAQACGDDAELRGEIESLLEHAHLAGNDFLNPLPPPAELAETAHFNTSTSATARSTGGKQPGPPPIPDYELVAPVGKGGFGEVWLARQRLTGVFYAGKVIPRDRIGAIELDGVRQYKQRAAGHPHLINLEHVGETEDCYYYVMELADDARGSALHDPAEYKPLTLAEYLQRKGALPTAEAIAIASHMLEALEHLHGAGLLHRDVKPANIMLRDGRWKLGDLGLVTTHDKTQIRAGTPVYSPREGVRDRSGDLFSLGRVLHELLTGHVSESVPGAKQSASGLRPLDPRLSDVVARACDPEPPNRFQTAAEMRAALAPGLSATRRMKRALLALLPVIAAIAYVLWGFGEHGWLASHGNDQPPRMEVHYKHSPEESGYEVLSEASVPLPTGSLILVHADLGRAGYPYLFGVSTDEPPVLLNPKRDQPPTLVRDFWSPSLAPQGQIQKWHPLKPPAGTVMLLLLVTDAPIANLDELVAQLKDFRCPERNRFELLEGDPAAPTLRWNHTRGFGPETTEAPKGVLKAVPGEWRSRFRSVRILAFSHEESTPSPDGFRP